MLNLSCKKSNKPVLSYWQQFLILVVLSAAACTATAPSTGGHCDTAADCTDPAMPLCDTALHLCYAPGSDGGVASDGPVGPECSEKVACPGQKPICVSGICARCSSSDQCGDSVCTSNGACVPLGVRVYVNNQNGTCAGQHAGTQDDPLCQIQPAIEVALTRRKDNIHVVESDVAYSAIKMNPAEAATLRIVGGSKDGKVVRIAQDGNVAVDIRADKAQVELTVVNMNFSSSEANNVISGSGHGSFNASGITVTGGLNGVWLDSGFTSILTQSRVSGAKQDGVSAHDSDITVTETEVSNNKGNGIVSTSAGFANKVNLSQVVTRKNRSGVVLTDINNIVIERCGIVENGRGLELHRGLANPSPITYTIENNLIASNGTGVWFDINKTQNSKFWFNTIANNGNGFPPADEVEHIALYCSQPFTTEFSILVANRRSYKTNSQAGAGCSVVNSAVGSGDFVGYPQNALVTPEFEPTLYQMKADSQVNRDCCIDKIPPGHRPDFPGLDYVGRSRPRGKGYEIGAQEVP